MRTSFALVYSSLYKTFWNEEPPSVDRNTPRSLFGPYGWPSAAEGSASWPRSVEAEAVSASANERRVIVVMVRDGSSASARREDAASRPFAWLGLRSFVILRRSRRTCSCSHR